MRLLFHPVTLILFAVTVTATPPPGYVHRPNDDKNPPNYQYKYEIGDVDGKESQGKVETRSGKLASGRYYVNDEQSSTDVKYFADEWGYHPLVKYRASNDHSAATAHFALGEHVVKALLNGTEVGDEVKLSDDKRQINHHHRKQQHRRRRPIQVIQPYTPAASEHNAKASSSSSSSALLESRPIEDHELSGRSEASPVNLLLNYDFQRKPSRGSEFNVASTESSASTVSGFQQNFNNYVTLPQISTNDRDYQRQSDARGAYSSILSSSTSDYRFFAPGNIYVTNPSTLEPLSATGHTDNHEENHESRQDSANDLFSTVSDDYLLVQNAGSFGRRLKPTSSNSLPNNLDSESMKVSNTRLNTGTSDFGTYSHASYSTTTPRTTISYSTEVEDRRHFSTTPIPDFQDVANSVSAETLANEYRNSIRNENSASGHYAGIFAKIFPNSATHGDAAEKINSLSTINSPLIRYESTEKNDSQTQPERATTPGLSAYGKSRDHELYVTLRQSLDSEIRDLSKVYSSTPQTLSTYNSKPIVVAELSSYNRDKGFEYSTTFPCTDESYENSTPTPSISSTGESLIDSSDSLHVTAKLQGTSHITTSSVILNPIQAGVSLVNAGETELISLNEQSSSPAPVNEHIEGERIDDSIKNFSATRINELEKIVADHTREEVYEKINSAFGQTSGSDEMDIGKSITRTDTSGVVHTDLGANSQDQQIEIQKSVEIYQNAPVHEIHYPPQVISQVSGINHQGQQQHQENSGRAVHQQVEQSRSYTELQDVENAKQFQQWYNNEHEQQQNHQSNTQISYENNHGAEGTESIHLGNVVRVVNEMGNYQGQQQTQEPNVAPEDHVQIIKMIRGNIPEVKYTPAKTPQINVHVYPSNIPDVGDNGQLIKAEEDISSVREQQVKAQAAAAGQTKTVQSQLQRILSDSDSVQRYFIGGGWTRHQEQQQQQQQQQRQQQQNDQREQYQVLEEPEKLEILRTKPDQVNYPEDGHDRRLTQPHQQQTIDFHYGQHVSSKDSSHEQTLGNVVEEMTGSHQAVPIAYLPPPVAEPIVQKTIHVPQPYPVEVPKIIEKKVPYPVEKIIERKVPYPVEKIVERKVPYPVEKIVERKVPYPVEKIVERKVPYPVEKIVEKKIPVPQPYPVHVPVDRIIEKQVQVLQPYPVHIEKIIEKKVPYPVQRLVPQPYPVHILQPYPVEKIVEKPVHIPVTVEKIVEKKVHVPHPYPVQIPIKVPYPVELTKYVEQSVQVPYGVRYGVSYQQIMKPQSPQGLYTHQGLTSLPVYGISLIRNQHRDRLNESQNFHGYSYSKPAVAFVTGTGDVNNKQTSNGWEQFANAQTSDLDHRQVFAKKSYVGQSSKLPLVTYNYSGLNRRQTTYRQNNVVGGDKSVGKDEYVGPVPAAQQQKQQQQQQSQSNPHQKSRSRSSLDQQQQLPLQPVQQHSTTVTRAAPLSTSATSSRRARQQQENPHYQNGPGAFRQSKIEYGFKPPMVPSIQYDEKTATKVEN